MSLHDDAEINRHSLDFEWERQAGLFEKYTAKHGNAVYERDALKDRMELFYSDMSLAVRRDPKRFIIDKVTDKAIHALVVKAKRYQEHTRELQLLNKDVNAYYSAKQVLEHKRTALEYLSKLFLAGYWSEPKIKQDARVAYSEKTSKAHSTVLTKNTRLKRR